MKTMKIINYVLLVFLLFISTERLLGQKQLEQLKLKTFPFGKYYNAEFYLFPSKINSLDAKYAKVGVFDKRSLFYSDNGHFQSNELRNLLDSENIKRIYLNGCTIDHVWPPDSVRNSVEIINSKITRIEGIRASEWFEMLYLAGNTINNNIFLYKSSFNSHVTFSGNKSKGIYFHLNNFKEKFVFNFNQVNEWVEFKEVKFYKDILFLNNEIIGGCKFIECVLPDIVDFSGTTFSSELSFINCNTDSMQTIILEDIIYPNGKLNLEWIDIKGVEKPRIGLDIRSQTSDKVTYLRFEKIYKKLRDNYLAQGKKESALEVMYELEWKKEIIFNDIKQIIYGKLFGYGYRPLLAITFIFIFIFIFIIINRLFFKNDIESIILNRTRNELNATNKYSNSTLGRISLFIANIWIVLIFSFGVFFGIRFKTDWLNTLKGTQFKDSFLLIITFQYVFGKVCLVLFVLFLKTYELYNIKSLFGLD